MQKLLQDDDVTSGPSLSHNLSTAWKQYESKPQTTEEAKTTTLPSGTVSWLKDTSTTDHPYTDFHNEIVQFYTHLGPTKSSNKERQSAFERVK